MTTKVLRWLYAIVILTSALVWIAPRALAQTDTQQIELVGTIQAVENRTTLTINELTVDASQAETTLAYAVGLAVKVEGELQDNGTILARQVKAAEGGIMPGEVELVGTLTSLNAATAVVSGLSFGVTGAEIEAGLAVGDRVEVHATPAIDGSWAAYEIKRYVPEGTPTSGTGSGGASTGTSTSTPAPREEFELIGTLTERGQNYIVVSGLTIGTQNAEMKEPLVVGILVKVHGTFVGATLTAREVEPAEARGRARSNVGDVCAFKVEVSSANLRSGPGTGYGVIGFALSDDMFPVVEISGSGAWLKVELAQGEAWVAASLGELEHDCSRLPVSSQAETGGGNTNSNGNDNDDDSNDNGDDNGNDNGDDHGNDNDDDHDDNGNDNDDDDDGDDDRNENDDD